MMYHTEALHFYFSSQVYLEINPMSNYVNYFQNPGNFTKYRLSIQELDAFFFIQKNEQRTVWQKHVISLPERASTFALLNIMMSIKSNLFSTNNLMFDRLWTSSICWTGLRPLLAPAGQTLVGREVALPSPQHLLPPPSLPLNTCHLPPGRGPCPWEWSFGVGEDGHHPWRKNLTSSVRMHIFT